MLGHHATTGRRLECGTAAQARARFHIRCAWSHCWRGSQRPSRNPRTTICLDQVKPNPLPPNSPSPRPSQPLVKLDQSVDHAAMSDLGASAMAAIKPLATMALEDHDANASARKFALSIPEDDLYKESLKYINGRHFKYPSDHPVVWVKFGGRERQAEADTQRLARNRVRKEHRADIHIPEVVTRAEGGTYIIMELLKATLLKDCVESSLTHCYDLITDGIQLLCRMPVPEDATPGPYAHDHKLRVIRHQIFADYQASTVYRSIGELEGHITRVGRPLHTHSFLPVCKHMPKRRALEPLECPRLHHPVSIWNSNLFFATAISMTGTFYSRPTPQANSNYTSLILSMPRSYHSASSRSLSSSKAHVGLPRHHSLRELDIVSPRPTSTP